MLSDTPNPGRVTKLPEAVKAKFLMLPLTSSGPALTVASILPTETTYSLPVASVLMFRFLLETVRNVPNFMLILSDLNLKPAGTPSLKVRAARTASLSLSEPSSNFIEKVFPGKRSAFCAAMKTSPLNCTLPLKSTPKSAMPAVIPLIFRIEANSMSPP